VVRAANEVQQFPLLSLTVLSVSLALDLYLSLSLAIYLSIYLSLHVFEQHSPCLG
jgi:hypothetical protein